MGPARPDLSGVILLPASPPDSVAFQADRSFPRAPPGGLIRALPRLVATPLATVRMDQGMRGSRTCRP